MNTRTRNYLLGFVSFGLVIALAFGAVFLDKNSSYTGEYKQEMKCSLSLNKMEDTKLVNDVIVHWLSETRDVDSAEKLYEQYREYGRLDYPESVTIGFSVSNVPMGAEITKQEVKISETEDFSEFICLNIPVDDRQIGVYNLKPGTKYYYSILVELSDGTTLKEFSTFNTIPGPRYMYVDGIRNVRDIGGYTTLDGKRVKWDMIYRGTEMDGAISEGKFVVKDEGVDTLVNHLNVKLQMDLRASNLKNSKDMLPSQVPHKYYSAFSYAEAFGEHGVKSLKKVFTDLADPANYPVYLHCTYGIDRTGTIVYLMGAVLGLDDDALYQEWALSTFFSGKLSFKKEMNEFVDIVQSFEGDTTQEKVTNYLLSLGITESQLESFKSIMLE